MIMKTNETCPYSVHLAGLNLPGGQWPIEFTMYTVRIYDPIFENKKIN